MNLLFVCSARIIDGQLVCASWIKSIYSCISKDYKIMIASTALAESETDDSLSEDIDGKILPFSFSLSEQVLETTLKKANPDVIVLFGTEQQSTYQTIEICDKLNMLDRTAIFAQGLCCVCAKHYAEGLPENVIKRYTLRDFLRFQNIKKEKDSLEKRAFFEKAAIEKTHNFIGRTTMDYAVFRMYNQKAEYYKCNDLLRSCFYEGQWKYSNCKKHRIFVSQYYYPLKGFHYLLEAVSFLKSKYPDITIAVAGYNPILKSLRQRELKDSSYIKYIKFLAKQYGLCDNIELLGELSEEEMKDEYLKANTFVMPSTIENSPNSLAEAMMLGVPSIVSDVGGVSDFAVHKVEAYIYPSSATYLLCHYIDKVFADREAAEVIGMKGKERAEKEYDFQRNISRFEEIMKDIANK